MYITELNINHLKEVAKLEKEVYPEELCLGYDDYLNDFKSVGKYNNSSLGVFVNGDLKAYIICYPKKRFGNYYVSDLVCPNPKMLLPLLIAFANDNNGQTLEAEMRYTSYRIIKHILKKYPDFVKVIEKKKVPSYYLNGEDMYQIKFKINVDQMGKYNPKFLILKEIYCCKNFQVEIKKILYSLYFEHNMSAEEIKKYKSFIMRHIHERNLDALRMVGDTFKFIVRHECTFNNKKAFHGMVQHLLQKGYTEEFNENSNDIMSHNNKFCAHNERYICWTTVRELDTKFKDDTISYYRSYLKRKFINYYKKKRFVKSVEIRDKYNVQWLTISSSDDIYRIIPRNYSNIFDSQLRKLEFIKNIRDTVDKLIPKENTFVFVGPEGVPAIRKYAGEDVAYAYFNKVIKLAKNAKDKTAVFHDWGFVISEIFQFEKYLTKGAIKHIFLDKSLNQINKIRDALAGLHVEGIDNLMDSKMIRKKISTAIKKDEPLAPIISEILQEIEKEWLRKKHISKELFEDMIAFVERMKKYSPHISINMLFKQFGRKTINMVKGQYEGLFKEKLITMTYKELGMFILETLDKRTKRNKRLFGALSKIQDIGEIFEGNILPENYDKVIAELKQRNIDVPEKFLNLNKFYAKVEHKCSPEYLIAGNASVCCMSFGQEKARTYALEKGFGIVNIYYKDRVIANSVIWINEPYNCLVLDNIEVHPNYKKFNDIIKNLFDETIKYLIQQYNLDFAVQGANYNDLNMYNLGNERIRFKVLKPVNVETENFYSDAHYVYPLDYKMSLEEVKNKINAINILLREKENKENSRADIEFYNEELPF